MKILPAALAPWRDVIERRHEPSVTQGRHGYQNYRSCLRWEYGFTCPFCLCHEADFVPRGAEGFGVTQIEHFVPVSHDAEGTNVYSNCFYSCRFCNRARGTTSNTDPMDGRHLLNPSSNVWAEHFVVADDHIEVQAIGDDASYTRDTYDLNDSRKVVRRRHRRETIEECLALVDQADSIIAKLLEKAAANHDPELVDTAAFCDKNRRKAWRDLAEYAVVPQDAPTVCACAGESLSIPEVLEEQTIEIEPPDLSGGKDSI